MNKGRIEVTIRPGLTHLLVPINKFHFGETKNNRYKELVDRMWKKGKFTSSFLKTLPRYSKEMKILTMNGDQINKPDPWSNQVESEESDEDDDFSDDSSSTEERHSFNSSEIRTPRRTGGSMISESSQS